MARILLLEDFRILREEVAGFLIECGHEVAAVKDLAGFAHEYQQKKFDVAIIDLGLPDGDGLELIERLRKLGDGVGIVVLTSRAGTANKIQGLVGGADHYLVKPIDLAELEATLVSVTRRMVVSSKETANSRWKISERTRCLVAPNGLSVELTSQGLTVLIAIVKGFGRVVSRRSLVEALGADYLTYDLRRLDTQIYQLRKLVMERCGVELPLLSARGQGYQLTEQFDLDQGS